MNTDYASIYRMLTQISDYYTDICESRAYAQLLEEAGLGTWEDNCIPLLQMQNAAESFPRMDASGTKDGMDGIIAQVRAYTDEAITQRLARYSADEQKTRLIHMVESAMILSNEPADDRCLPLLRLKSMRELRKCLTDRIMKIAVSMVAKIAKKESLSSEGESVEALECSALSLGACAGAAYICSSKLRPYPELLGATSGAAVAIDKLTDKDDDENDGSYLANIIAVLVTLAATVTIWELWSALIPAGAASALLLRGSDAFKQLKDRLKDCIDTLFMELKIGERFNATRLLERAFRCVINAMQKKESADVEDDDFIVDPYSEKDVDLF